MKNCSNIQNILVLIILFGSCFVYTINYLTISRIKEKTTPFDNLLCKHFFLLFCKFFVSVESKNCIARHAYFFKPGLALLNKQKTGLPSIDKIDEYPPPSPQAGQLADDVPAIIDQLLYTKNAKLSIVKSKNVRPPLVCRNFIEIL